MGLHSVLCLMLAIGAGAAPANTPAADNAGVDADKALAAYLPATGAAPGVRMVEEPTFYHPDDLYEYINGAAGGFLAYNFQRLATATYRYGDTLQQQIVIDLYQMPTLADGFGIYSSESSPDLKFMKLGAQGYIAGNMCIFWKNRHYVKLAARSNTPDAQRVLLRIARGIAKRLPGPVAAPKLLKVFPPRGLIRHSEKYLAHNLLGHAFMPSGFVADYHLEEEHTRLFVAIADEADAAGDAHRRLRDFFGEYGEVWRDVTGLGDNAFIGKEPFYGRSIIVRQDRIIGGVLAAPGDEEGVRLVRDLLRNTAARLKR